MSVRAMGVVGEARWLLEQVLYRALYYGYSEAIYDLTLMHSENKFSFFFSFEVTPHFTFKFSTNNQTQLDEDDTLPSTCLHNSRCLSVGSVSSSGTCLHT